MTQNMGKTPQRGIVKRGSKRNTAAQPAKPAAQLPTPPQNVGDLRGLLRQYGNVLTPQNRQLLQDVITQLEKGDKAALQSITARLQKQLGKK